MKIYKMHNIPKEDLQHTEKELLAFVKRRWYRTLDFDSYWLLTEAIIQFFRKKRRQLYANGQIQSWRQSRTFGDDNPRQI